MRVASEKEPTFFFHWPLATRHLKFAQNNIRGRLNNIRTSAGGVGGLPASLLKAATNVF